MDDDEISGEGMFGSDSSDDDPDFGEDASLLDPDFGDFTDDTWSEQSGEEHGIISEVHAPVMIEVDTTEHFQTNMEFQSSNVVLEYARKVGRKHGVVVVVQRSDINDKKRRPRIMLGCERGGGYRGKGKTKDSVRRSSTKKCGCPFSLKAHVTDMVSGVWGLVVLNGWPALFASRMARFKELTSQNNCNTATVELVD